MSEHRIVHEPVVIVAVVMFPLFLRVVVDGVAERVQVVPGEFLNDARSHRVSPNVYLGPEAIPGTDTTSLSRVRVMHIVIIKKHLHSTITILLIFDEAIYFVNK